MNSDASPAVIGIFGVAHDPEQACPWTRSGGEGRFSEMSAPPSSELPDSRDSSRACEGVVIFGFAA